ncbi:MAG: hypothetical protein [Arizlama microvirus]|nr:MAG: hypothetical protein [Arizlama microvirus]
MKKLFRPIKFKNRKRSTYDEVMAIMAHKEAQKERQGFESFAEANDFYIPDDNDPLERYFSQPTPHERFAEMSDDGFRRLRDGVIMTTEQLKQNAATTPSKTEVEAPAAS